KTYLFPSRDPRRGPEQPITDKMVWIACQEAAHQAGLGKRITPHTLRHYLPFRTMSGNEGPQRV
ncbi:MAG TPA: tyrosine-type recombinase/integrase, partial [Terriglobia bacterium]|nr:tyrosine-type recombinase/integrase [Terriglobia bacterium]